jgi:anion-transporting  ArsA/GET3 family ATPase
MDTEASLREYLTVNLRVPMVGRIGPIASVFDFVATAAPGVKEILTIGKICWEVREALEGRAPWDLVLVDAAASGHVVAQLGAPQAIGELVHVGAVHHQTEWLQQILVDPALTALTVVTTPEEMPVAETIELVATVRRELEVPLAAVFVNRVLPELLARADEAVFEALVRPSRRPCSRSGPDRAPPRSSRRVGWPCRCGGPGSRTWPACRRPSTCRSPTCPSCSRASPASA